MFVLTDFPILVGKWSKNDQKIETYVLTGIPLKHYVLRNLISYSCGKNKV